MADDLHYLREKLPPRFIFVRPVMPDDQRGIACTGWHLRAYADQSGDDALRWERVSMREWLQDHIRDLVDAGKVQP